MLWEPPDFLVNDYDEATSHPSWAEPPQVGRWPLVELLPVLPPAWWESVGDMGGEGIVGWEDEKTLSSFPGGAAQL